MTFALHILFTAMAWIISFTRLVKIIRRGVWKTDRGAIRIWWATFLFAIVVTFLVTPASAWIDRYTLPNFARLIAYSAIMLTLHIIVSSSLSLVQTRIHQFQRRLLTPFLAVGLVTLFLLYILFVRETPGWNEAPYPVNTAQAVFQFVPFFWAAIFCLFQAISSWQYLRLETVEVTRYRMIFILLTSASGVLMFTGKFLYALGYFWPPFNSTGVQTVNSILEISTVLLWGCSFLHNSAYTRLNGITQGVRNWALYRDLSFLASSLSEVCPSVGLEYQSVGYVQFVQRADYYLYRAMVHILDGKVILADMIGDNPIETSEHIEQKARLHEALQQAGSQQSFYEMVSKYSRIGRDLRAAV